MYTKHWLLQLLLLQLLLLLLLPPPLPLLFLLYHTACMLRELGCEWALAAAQIATLHAQLQQPTKAYHGTSGKETSMTLELPYLLSLHGAPSKCKQLQASTQLCVSPAHVQHEPAAGALTGSARLQLMWARLC